MKVPKNSSELIMSNTKVRGGAPEVHRTLPLKLVAGCFFIYSANSSTSL